MIYIALGSNLPSSFGNPEQNLQKAMDAMSQNDFRILKISQIYTTSPVPYDPDQPDFKNMVIGVEDILEPDRSPHECLDTLLLIEQEFGRVRTVKNAARTLDLDIIAIDDLILNDDVLTLPHPHMHERGFVLQPMNDIAPDWVHPVRQKTVANMLGDL